MQRYLITQSLISSWNYFFDCREGCEDDAEEEFMRALRREKDEPTEAMLNGIAFENAVYDQANGIPYTGERWTEGVKAVSSLLIGAQFQVRLSRELQIGDMTFLVYGILDGLKAGTIYDVKFMNKSMASVDIYGKYLNSPQHSFYFYLVPEASMFKYLVSDGNDLYVEQYSRDDTRSICSIISEFVKYIDSAGLLDLYKEKWEAK